MLVTHKIAWDKCLSHQLWPAIEKGWKDEGKNVHFFWGLAGKNIPEIAECERKGEEWVKPSSSDWEDDEKIIIQFVMPSAANKLQLYNKLKSEIKKNKKIQGRFDESKIKSYEIANPLLGGQEFALMGEDLRTLFVMTGKKLNDIQTQWTGEF